MNKKKQNRDHGKCWLCIYGEPYRKQSTNVYDYDKSDKLTICTLGKHGDNVIAKTQRKDCESWKLKQ